MDSKTFFGGLKIFFERLKKFCIRARENVSLGLDWNLKPVSD